MYTREGEGSRRRRKESTGEVAQRRKREEPFGKLRGNIGGKLRGWSSGN
jgi:hypothetical protein